MMAGSHEDTLAPLTAPNFSATVKVSYSVFTATAVPAT
jgi:hypothetical protein